MDTRLDAIGRRLDIARMLVGPAPVRAVVLVLPPGTSHGERPSRVGRSLTCARRRPGLGRRRAARRVVRDGLAAALLLAERGRGPVRRSDTRGGSRSSAPPPARDRGARASGSSARAAPRSRRAACAGTCRRAARARACSPSLAASALTSPPASWGCTRRRRCRGAPSAAEPPQRLPGEPGARRVDDDDVGRARALSELLERLADVAREEGGVRDAVQVGVLERAGDRLLRDLDAPDGERVGARARARSCRCRSRGRRPSRGRSAPANSRASS